MPIDDFARKIAGMVFLTELRASRMLGYSEVEGMCSACNALDETYLAVFDAERPAVLTRFRPIADLAEDASPRPSPAQRGDEVIHSQFPWSIHPQAPTAVFDAGGMKAAIAVGPNAEDNAALIAAIPLMVGVLKEISFHRCPTQDGGWKTSSAASAARAVLALIGKKP